MRIALICHNRGWADPAEPFRAVAAGLRRLGHEVKVVAPAQGRPWSRRPDAAFLWNGIHGPWAEPRRHLAEAGKPVFIMERGFFDRGNYTQIDHAGFNHTASWACELTRPAPEGGWERFLRLCPGFSGRGHFRGLNRRPGYVLVLLQVPADAQLQEAELHHPGPLVQAVEAAAPNSLEIRVRAHPLSLWECGTLGRAQMIDGTLEQAIAAAKFCVTINSNAGNEALARGCPVLCLGPALYAAAGAARRTTLAELWRAIAEMEAGWQPEQTIARNYLAWLAARQWSRDELAAAWPLEAVLKRAPP
ncbi:MAG: hypothetical protein AMJ81_13950 [Phycisphaerae bacterium SM23_33]|nr:MAG: hypothetical protein AMJ81_13950 [Phycisphaerae bacterium SM23_33]